MGLAYSYEEGDYRLSYQEVMEIRDTLFWLLRETRNGSLKDNPAAVAALPGVASLLIEHYA